ncbi:MAG: P63C domain-containing protein [Magnetospirillum sp.]|nr:P63C domain-containing protein [Magnetospirillum sp.]
MSTYIWPELEEKLKNPIVFQTVIAGQSAGSGPKAHGYDVTILIDVCKAILKADADKKLTKSQLNVAKQAAIIVGASAKAGIQGLVYALAGYDRTKEEFIAAYKMYVMEEAREYEREFSPELYEQWYRLYGLTKPERGRPWEFKYLTIDHIYKPLAKSNGKVFSLAKSSKKTYGDKNDKIHQFLSEIGVKALRTQVGKILGIAMVSKDRDEYEKHIEEKIYGEKRLI